MILVYRYRVKSLNGLLNKQSRAVNYVWNFCNDTQKHALKWSKKWPTGFDLNVLTTGSSKELGIHSGTVNATCEQYAKSRSQHRRPLRRFDYIAVGNVSAKKLAKTRMAKSVYDASWSSFRNKLRYKAIAHGVTFEEVDESGSTQSCSSCGSKDSTTRPKGIAGLRIREWVCGGCGVLHDRDTNAALNILRCGRASPGVGILSL
ncbi:transposase [Burkholderia sp. ABCPW 11]|uniref:RNA-guided endonuclease InsQ/TnpB family protein n=1 Tax=Burkholderia sp. ABCPW 11 TaxID=1637859 RepID=UPI00075CA5AF|nr:zinc ribbon domain-containing protein [Burkholderia sp. ABCPW 11]KVD42980.1 transposase [Burkholderia sp. ABCPW 11]